MGGEGSYLGQCEPSAVYLAFIQTSLMMMIYHDQSWSLAGFLKYHGIPSRFFIYLLFFPPFDLVNLEGMDFFFFFSFSRFPLFLWGQNFGAL